MRYFFNSSGKCIAIITENPKNLDVPKEAANATYAYDGDKGRSLNTVFLDKTYVMQNGITVNLSAFAEKYDSMYEADTRFCKAHHAKFFALDYLIQRRREYLEQNVLVHPEGE